MSSRTYRRLLAEHYGDHALALEHAADVIDYLSRQIPFGFIRTGTSAYKKPADLEAPIPDPVLIPGEPL